jgi:hypothetical protein
MAAAFRTGDEKVPVTLLGKGAGKGAGHAVA